MNSFLYISDGVETPMKQFLHHMIREIHEQPQAVQTTLTEVSRDGSKIRDKQDFRNI